MTAWDLFVLPKFTLETECVHCIGQLGYSDTSKISATCVMFTSHSYQLAEVVLGYSPAPYQ